jgi:hypothetical protein
VKCLLCSGIMFEQRRDNDHRGYVSKPPRFATVIPVNSASRGERGVSAYGISHRRTYRPRQRLVIESPDWARSLTLSVINELIDARPVGS